MNSRPKFRRGVTLLETVFAIVLLVLVATSVVSALSFMNNSEVRFKRQLAAFEVANRLLLQYLDDPQAMPDASLPYVDEESGLMCRWSVTAEPIRFNSPEHSYLATTSTDHGRKALDASVVLRARVFAGMPDGVGGVRVGEQLAELSRPMNIVAVKMRNPDVAKRLETPEGLVNYINTIMKLMNGESVSNTNASTVANGTASSTGVWARSGSGGVNSAAPFGNGVVGSGNGRGGK